MDVATSQLTRVSSLATHDWAERSVPKSLERASHYRTSVYSKAGESSRSESPRHHMMNRPGNGKRVRAVGISTESGSTAVMQMITTAIGAYRQLATTDSRCEVRELAARMVSRRCMMASQLRVCAAALAVHVGNGPTIHDVRNAWIRALYTHVTDDVNLLSEQIEEAEGLLELALLTAASEAISPDARTSLRRAAILVCHTREAWTSFEMRCEENSVAVSR